MIIQAGPFRLFPDGYGARAHAERDVHDLQNVLDAHPSHIRAEIFASLSEFAGNGKGGKFFRSTHFDVRIRFIVLQKDIVFRFIFFDQIVFERKGVDLRFGNDIVKIGDIGDHRHNFFRLDGGMEILSDAVFQVARLTDVDHVAVSVQHNINARVVGKQF